MNDTATTKLQSQLVKAIGHPLRQKILALLNEAEASPSDIAASLDEPVGNVAYHVKILLEYEAIELVRTAQVRGAVEHFYRPRMQALLGDHHWSSLPVSVRRRLDDQRLQRLWEHLVEAMPAGGMDADGAHLSVTVLELDSVGADALAELLDEALAGIRAISADAKERLAAADQQGASTSSELAILHFGHPVEDRTESTNN